MRGRRCSTFLPSSRMPQGSWPSLGHQEGHSSRFNSHVQCNDEPTKRKIASDVAKTFDLLGWFAPCTIVVKVLLQELWKLNLAWDDTVSENISHKWKKWREELSLITSHPIPRYHLEKGKQVRSLQLHGFSDASDSAYAGVVYLRAVYSDTSVSTSLLIAKTKVTPICGSTTPRKELCGAQLLSKILITASNALYMPGVIQPLYCAGCLLHLQSSSLMSVTESWTQLAVFHPHIGDMFLQTATLLMWHPEEHLQVN